MSSTSAPSSEAAASSPTVQSTNNTGIEQTSNEITTAEKTIRPPSAQKTAADTSRAPVIAASGAGISPGAPASGTAEAISPTSTPYERPFSANKQPANTTSTGSRPGSAAKNVDPTLTPRLDETTATSTTARPASANKKSENIATTDTNPVTTGSRPPSASKKQGDITGSSTTAAVTGSRPPSANRKQDNAAAPGSRPASAARKKEETSTDSTVTEQQDASAAPIDPNDPNLTQPIIGRPSSAAKKGSDEGRSAITTLVAAVPLVSLPSDVPAESPDNNSKPITTAAAPPPPPTPTRVGSASKPVPTPTTTEGNP